MMALTSFDLGTVNPSYANFGKSLLLHVEMEIH